MSDATVYFVMTLSHPFFSFNSPHPLSISVEGPKRPTPAAVEIILILK